VLEQTSWTALGNSGARTAAARRVRGVSAAAAVARALLESVSAAALDYTLWALF